MGMLNQFQILRIKDMDVTSITDYGNDVIKITVYNCNFLVPHESLVFTV